MNRKDIFSCFMCNKIQEESVFLPCLCKSICHKHLNDKIKKNDTNTIHCSICNKDFNVNRESFRPNKQMRDLIKLELYLSDDEKRQKDNLDKGLTEIVENSEKSFKRKNNLKKKTFFFNFRVYFLIKIANIITATIPQNTQ